MLCQDVLTNDVEVQEAVTGGGVSEVNSASEGKMKVLKCPDVNIIPHQPVQSGLIPPDVVDNEERCQPVLGLEGCSLPEVTGTGPNACEGKICQSININTANIALSTINYL